MTPTTMAATRKGRTTGNDPQTTTNNPIERTAPTALPVMTKEPIFAAGSRP
ncbi:MAG TPA: hypothetical protein VJO53_08690 [Candidatus Acidoferrales bacterium]|nr:hypothetical protein [Candidatus Acidoferrales bacterium]